MPAPSARPGLGHGGDDGGGKRVNAGLSRHSVDPQTGPLACRDSAFTHGRNQHPGRQRSVECRCRPSRGRRRERDRVQVTVAQLLGDPQVRIGVDVGQR